MDVTLMGNKRLYEIMKEKEVLYNKTDFTDADGIKLGNLEAELCRNRIEICRRSTKKSDESVYDCRANGFGSVF